jgi:glycosyl transferase, family 25
MPSPIGRWVDAVYVLSVKSFDQRIAHVKSELGRHGIPFEFVFEHDAAEMDPALVDATFAPSDLGPGQQSLVLKNIHIWRTALARAQQRVLVFEDDVVLREDFAPRFEEAMRALEKQPPGWLLFLGGLDTKVPDRYFLAPGPLVELPIATAEACVYDAEAMRRRLAWLENHRVTLAADFLMRHVDAQMGVKQFWLRHPVAEQGSVLGLFDSKLDKHRLKHSRAFNILRNRWNKFQRRRLREWLARAKQIWKPNPL